MKRIALSLLSAALLSTAIPLEGFAIAPLAAQAATAPTQSQTAQPSLLSQIPGSVRRSPSPLEQRRQDELDHNGNQNGSLNRPPAATPTDVERPQGTPSALEQRRLDELDRNSQNGSLNRPPAAAPADREPSGSVQTSRLHQARLNYLDNR